MRRNSSLLFGFALTLAACSGVSPMATPVTSGGAGASAAALAPSRATLGYAETGLAALGMQIREATSEVLTMVNPVRFGKARVVTGCVDGVEFQSPDSSGKADTSETKLYADSTCTKLVFKQTRSWTSTGTSSESLQLSSAVYSNTLQGTFSGTATITKASFDAYGYPSPKHGFVRNATEDASTTYGSGKFDSEFILQSGGNEACSDSAGLAPIQVIPPDTNAFGWEEQSKTTVTLPTRVDGLITFTTGPVTGDTQYGVYADMSIATGTLNTTCPITTPAYTLKNGGATKDFETKTITISFRLSQLRSVGADQIDVGGGVTMDAQSQSAAGGRVTISGEFRRDGARIAGYAVDAFGNGALTTKGGGYKIVNWLVEKPN